MRRGSARFTAARRLHRWARQVPRTRSRCPVVRRAGGVRRPAGGTGTVTMPASAGFSPRSAASRRAAPARRRRPSRATRRGLAFGAKRGTGGATRMSASDNGSMRMPVSKASRPSTIDKNIGMVKKTPPVKFPATRAVTVGMIKAAPRPSRTDQPRKSTTTFGEMAANPEPAAYTTSPIRNARRRPSRSPSLPPDHRRRHHQRVGSNHRLDGRHRRVEIGDQSTDRDVHDRRGDRAD